jgi:crossover junction endodeoxyribonuclease RusA
VTTFFVPGKPVTQGSKRHVGGGRMIEQTEARLKPWRKTIADIATRHRARDAALFPDQALTVELEFLVRRPKYAIGKLLPAIKRGTGDVDKLARAVLDALTGVCYRDDSQVTTLITRKRLTRPGEEPGVWITYRRDTSHLEQELSCVTPPSAGTASLPPSPTTTPVP